MDRRWTEGIQRRSFYCARTTVLGLLCSADAEIPRVEAGDFRVFVRARRAASQKAASSSSMMSLSSVSITSRVAPSIGRKFFAKNDATATLPS